MTTESQLKQLSIWPHFTGPLSMIGSALIINQILRSPSKKKRVYHRILLALSLCDFNVSIWYALSTWPIPKGTPDVYAAIGTKATCTAQGFFQQYDLASPLYNTVLAFYYCLTIRFKWGENRMKKIEKYLLSIPIIFVSITAFASLGLNLLHSADMWCWIGPDPSGVDNNYKFYRWLFYYGPLWAAIISSGVCMLLTYLSVRQTETASLKWKMRASQRDLMRRSQRDMMRGDGASAASNTSTSKKKSQRDLMRASSASNTSTSKKKDEDRKHSKQVATQAMLYLSVFFFSYAPATVSRSMQMMNVTPHNGLYIVMAIFMPMQGFLNFLVYVRPRWITNRKKHPEWGRFKAFVMVLQPEGEREVGSESRGSYFSTIRRFSSELRNSFSRRRSSFSISRRSSTEAEGTTLSRGLSSMQISELQKDHEEALELEKEGSLGGIPNPNEEEKVEDAVAEDLELGHSNSNASLET